MPVLSHKASENHCEKTSVSQHWKNFDFYIKICRILRIVLVLLVFFHMAVFSNFWLVWLPFTGLSRQFISFLKYGLQIIIIIIIIITKTWYSAQSRISSKRFTKIYIHIHTHIHTNRKTRQHNKNDVDTSSGPGAFTSSMLLIAAIISSLEIDIFRSLEHPDLFCNKSFNSSVNNPVFVNTFYKPKTYTEISIFLDENAKKQVYIYLNVFEK